jgi:hypothetical protein
MLLKNFNEWVYVGSPLTPNALRGGKANFPEFQRARPCRQLQSRGDEALRDNMNHL